MAGITLEKGKTVYTKGQPMTALHLITGGRIEVSYSGGTYQLIKGDVVGICEICSEIHFLSYTTLEDTTFLTYPLSNINSLDDVMQKHPDVARLFLLSLFRQITLLQNHYSISELHCSDLFSNLSAYLDKYNTLCRRYRLPIRTLDGIQELQAYLCEDTPDMWLNDYYAGLTHIYASDNYRYFVEESSVSIGMVRKGSLDFRKTFQSIDEQFNYIKQIARFYFNESNNDIYDFYTTLYYKIGPESEDAEDLLADINRMLQTIQETSAIDETFFQKRTQSFQSNLERLNREPATPVHVESDNSIMLDLAGSLNTILEYSGVDSETAASFRKHVHDYTALADRASLDTEISTLRKAITAEFNQIYAAVFKQTLELLHIPVPVRMFLYFGYVDEELAGMDNAAYLYKLADNMTDYSSSGVYTLYDWMLAIYNGQKEPSRNEFEQDYADFIHRQKLSGNITDAEFQTLQNSGISKVNYELKNMFPQVNKISFGRIATFCPLFSADNVLKDLDTCYVTAAQVGKAIAHIRSIDYSAFYREGFDNEHIDIMGKETIHREYLPDIILMPNVGIRGVMWQEIEGKKRNSPGRMMFSIFHMEDLQTSLVRLTGEFRWEMCKRIQGARWNDISERSLTSEYFDYVQFYRKNHDLTPEAKEKVRTSLQKAKNSFKEMFVRDYIVWVLFEGAGSPRLNKVARKILFSFCPFPANICETLMPNPMYSELLHRHKIQTAQRVHHLNMLKQKIANSKKKVPYTLEAELRFAQGTPDS